MFNVVTKYNICLQNVAEGKYKVAENGKYSRANALQNIVLLKWFCPFRPTVKYMEIHKQSLIFETMVYLHEEEWMWAVCQAQDHCQSSKTRYTRWQMPLAII